MSSSFEREKNGKLSFLDIEVSREKGKFVTTVYRKPTFSGVYTQFIPYYGETDRHLKVRSAEHIGISSLTFKKTKPSKESAIRDHLSNCNKIPSFEEFTILTNGNNKFDLEIKESLLIKRDRPILNKNISSAKLFLFDNS